MKKLKGVISVFALSLCLLSPAQAEELNRPENPGD